MPDDANVVVAAFSASTSCIATSVKQEDTFRTTDVPGVPARRGRRNRAAASVVWLVDATKALAPAAA